MHERRPAALTPSSTLADLPGHDFHVSPVAPDRQWPTPSSNGPNSPG